MHSGKAPKIAVILLNYNNHSFTIDCIESLHNCGYADLDIIVVDNGSKPASPAAVVARFPQVLLLAQPENYGFSVANNIGMIAAWRRGADYALILNNDTLVKSGFLQELLDICREADNRAIACPRIYFQDPPAKVWYGGSHGCIWLGRLRHFYGEPRATDDTRRTWPVPFVTGCCILIPREVYERVGGFDPYLFAYCEDFDLSARCRKAGVAVLYAPRAHIQHRVCGTWGGYKSTRRDSQALYKLYLLTRNQLWMVRRHCNGWQKFIYMVLLPVGLMKRMIPLLCVGNGPAVRAQLRGHWDGLKFLPVFNRQETEMAELNPQWPRFNLHHTELNM